MAWSTSTRRADLPPNWNILRRVILQRDPTCQLRLADCTILSTEVDHIGERTDHRPSSLRGVCHKCHAKRTHEQSIEAKRAKRTRVSRRWVGG